MLQKVYDQCQDKEDLWDTLYFTSVFENKFKEYDIQCIYCKNSEMYKVFYYICW